MSSTVHHNTVHWFRKGLRLHDNPALLSACQSSNKVWPVFILDPWFVQNSFVGINRWAFLLQTLQDLDKSFRSLGGRLFVLQGNPADVLKSAFKKWGITQLTYEVDTEPYALQRDKTIETICNDLEIKVVKKISHTLYDSNLIITQNAGIPPKTYQRFQTIISQLGTPDKPIESIIENLKNCTIAASIGIDGDKYNIPTLMDMDLKLNDPSGDEEPNLFFHGGETEALSRMERNLKKTNWICNFEKPKTEPNSLQPSTTVLSPYLKFGCLSVRTFYWKVQDIYSKCKKHSDPPVSLHGQLLWREFFYTVGYGTGGNFNQIEGNTICRQITWDDNSGYLSAWRNAQTGYPFIDAIMTQLRMEGWIHHLARHSVACFLTRGDLWISWEEGQKVFEEWLLDADWFLNAGNWMWLSASAFFHQYYRVYSPIVFGKKTDKRGEYIKKYLPQLKKFPAEYIYEPWKAPVSVQKAAGCIIGTDYPKPIVDHDKIRVVNIERMKIAYNANKSESLPTASPKKRKTKSSSSPSSKKNKKTK